MLRYIFILICIISCLDMTQAQIGCFSQFDSIESGNTNMFLDSYAIKADHLDNYYITGGRMNDTISYNGNKVGVGVGNIFLLKFNKYHNLVWSRKGSRYNDNGYARALTIDDQDNIIVGGYYEQILVFGNDTLTNQNGSSQNAFISKFQPDGTLLWSRRVHTPGVFSSGQIISLSSDAYGNIYFGGAFGGTVIFGQDTIQNLGYGDHYWGKIDPLGNIEWIKAAGSNLGEHGVNIAADSIGNLYLIGCLTNNYLADSAYFDNINIPIDDRLFSFIAKYSTSGQLLWLKGAQKGGFNEGKVPNEGKIDVAKGVVAVTGTIWSDSGLVKIAGVQAIIDSSKRIAFALKLDTAGNGLWLKAIIWSLSSTSSQGLAIKIKDNGNIFLVSGGYGHIVGNDTIYPGYPTPVFFNLNGQNGQIISYCFPEQYGNGALAPRSLTSMGDTIMITGVFAREVNGQCKIFIAKFDGLVGIEEKHFNTFGITLFPNPNKGSFALELQKNNKFEVEQLSIYNIIGQQVFSKKVGFVENAKINIHLPSLSKGIYFLILRSEKGYITKKFVIQ